MYRHICVCVCIWEKERCSRATIRVRSLVRLLFINDSLKNNRYSWRQSLCDVQSTPVCLTGFIIVSIRALALFEYFNNERYSVVGTGDVLFAVVCIYISQNTHIHWYKYTLYVYVYIYTLCYIPLWNRMSDATSKQSHQTKEYQRTLCGVAPCANAR